MSFVYTIACQNLASGDFDFEDVDDAADTWRVALVMTNTTADTDRDTAEFLVTTPGVGITTPDFYDVAGGNTREEMDNDDLTIDTGNNRAEYQADTGGGGTTVWSAVNAGARQAQAILLYQFVTDDTASKVFAYIDGTGLPFTGNGSDVTVTWNAAGIVQFFANP